MWSRSLRAKWQRPHPKALLSLALAVLAGFAAHLLNIPLAWVLGPLVATAVASIAGLPLFAPIAGRRFGQVTIGTSIGLNVTASVLATVLLWLPLMIVTACVAIVVAAVFSVPFAHISRLDERTAYYAMIPGGLSEMANIGAASGAQPEPIALLQALRVALSVLIIPPFIVSLDIQGLAFETSNTSVLSAGQTIFSLMLGAGGVALARLARLNNPWMIGAVIGSAGAAAAGLMAGRIPYWLFYFGQFMIGLSIGSRFKRETLMRLPRVATVGSCFVIVIAAVLFGYAFLVSRTVGLDLATAALGASPGGFTEMAVTAQILHLSVGVVTGFHVVRAIIVNGFTEHFRKFFERIGLFSAVRHLLRRVI